MSETTSPSAAVGRAERELTLAESAILGEADALASQLMALCLSLETRSDINKRDLAIARTNLQTGLMWLTRSIVKPDRF